MTKFSVLCSVYKNDNPVHLDQALSSISVDQTLGPNEIIIIKDGLVEKALNKVIKKHVESLPEIFKVFGYKKNRGLGYALNYGLNKCSNEIVFRMDADDISLPSRFEKQMNCFKLNPKIAIIGTNIDEFNLCPGDLNQKRTAPLTSEKIQKTLPRRSPFNHMTVGFKKSVVMNVGSYKDMPSYEDYYLWVRILKNNDGLNLEESLVYARIGNDMIGRRHGLSFFFKEIAFQNRLLFEGYQNIYSWLINIVLRAPVRLLPKKLLGFFYKKILRSKL